jgi:predicted nucleic acid-binding protein
MVFDSSTLILFLNAALTEQPTALLARALEESAAVISAVTRAEVLAWPSHTVTSLNNATALLDAFQLVAVDRVIADEAARIRREHGVKLPDALIAATALQLKLALVTANARDFQKIKGLQVVEA